MVIIGVTEVEIWPEILQSVISGLLLILALANCLIYNKRIYVVIVLLCSGTEWLGLLSPYLSHGCSITQLAIADFVTDLVPPLLITLIGWLLSLWCTSTAAILSKQWPSRIHRLFIILWISIFLSTLVCLVGHAQFYLMWSNAIEADTNGEQHNNFVAFRAFSTLMIPGLIAVFLWVVVLIIINIALCRYCMNASVNYHPKGLADKQWQLYVLLVSKISCLCTLWLRLIVVASTLCAFHDANDSVHAMPLFAPTVTSLGNDDPSMFWINYSARICVLIGLAGHLVVFGRMGRVDKPVILRSICNGPMNSINTSKISVAPIQVDASSLECSNSMIASSYSSSKMTPIDTTLHTIIEYSEDEEDTNEEDEEHSCESIEDHVETTSEDNEQQMCNQQQELNSPTSDVAVHQLKEATTTNNTASATNNDDNDSYELSSILSEAIIQGRSRKTMLKLATKRI
ncbi:hypothetical protein BDF22DRAFT_689858 [Syncephalis plumigaleata]|nr:hypothetical protein BDF22DRAFT_689858 [Syncephalis plumigaleata]